MDLAEISDLFAPADTWRAQAICRRLVPAEKDRFYSYDTLDQDYAKAICSQCPVADPCYAHAVAHHEYGIWGGTTEADRRSTRKQRKRAG